MIPQAPFIQRCLWYNFSLPQLKVSENLPTSVPANPQGPECHWGTSNGIATALSSRSRQTQGDKGKNKSQTLLWVPPAAFAVLWRRNRNFQMENNLQAILSFSIEKWGWKISVTEQWRGLGGPCQGEGQRFPIITRGLEVALVPQNISKSLTALVANCTEEEVAQLSQNCSESGGSGCSNSHFREWGIQMIPFSPGEELQLSFGLHVSLVEFILPGTLQNPSEMWDTPFRTWTWWWFCPIPAASITFLALLYPPPLPFCLLGTRSWHNFPDDILVRNDTF